MPSYQLSAMDSDCSPIVINDSQDTMDPIQSDTQTTTMSVALSQSDTQTTLMSSTGHAPWVVSMLDVNLDSYYYVITVTSFNITMRRCGSKEDLSSSKSLIIYLVYSYSLFLYLICISLFFLFYYVYEAFF